VSTPNPAHLARELKPSEYLVLVILAASAQAGEPHYTFPATVAAGPARSLAGRGLAVVLDQQLGSITAALTGAGQAAVEAGEPR
jgi:hypothetical protein